MTAGILIGIVLVWGGGFLCGYAYSLHMEGKQIAKLKQDVDENGRRIAQLLAQMKSL